MPPARSLHLGALFSPVPGHLHPFGVLARELVRRGHRVTALNIPDVAAASEAQGMGFHAVGADVMPPGSWERYWTPIATSTGLGAIRATARAHRMVTRAMCEGAEAAHRTLGLDGLLVDEIQFQGRSIAEHLGLPFVTVAPFIPMRPDAAADRPPPFLPFDRAGGSPVRRLVNRAGYQVLELLAGPVIRETNRHARRWGVPRVRRIADTYSPLLHLTQCPPSLDFGGARPAAGVAPVHHVGSLLDPHRPAVPFPWERLDARRPLVYVSLGTLQNQRWEIYRAILDGLDRLDVQGVLTLGRWRGGDGPAPAVPDRHVVVPFAPQQEVIARAACVVTHAGMNTTIEALAHGVPLVLVPITNDQPAVAARVARAGAGVRLPLARLRADRVAGAVARVLGDPAHAEAARALRAEIRDAGGVGRAADLIEGALCATGTPGARGGVP